MYIVISSPAFYCFTPLTVRTTTTTTVRYHFLHQTLNGMDTQINGQSFQPQFKFIKINGSFDLQ
jgi:hypothetical protein|tara:strand:- start:1466 stop:1657 length:192 start_codon:yes stop_codon:yes gene_type:complete